MNRMMGMIGMMEVIIMKTEVTKEKFINKVC
jgi:hypothetical protein